MNHQIERLIQLVGIIAKIYAEQKDKDKLPEIEELTKKWSNSKKLRKAFFG